MRTVEVTDELQEYLDGLVPKRDHVLARMDEEAHRENIPIVDPHEGMLLYLLVKIAGAKRVLELGTATGYSGIWLLRGTDGGTLTTYEMDKERARRARSNFSDAGLGDRALVLADNALRQGEVVQPKNQQARNVRRYNELVANDRRLEGVVVPIRDGLSIARVRD